LLTLEDREDVGKEGGEEREAAAKKEGKEAMYDVLAAG
jgi:hypothetical protein